MKGGPGSRQRAGRVALNDHAVGPHFVEDEIDPLDQFGESELRPWPGFIAPRSKSGTMEKKART